ncbi:MAG: GNAT family N-acetyltransferase [Planctomycetes bacterium]|nr:GNAT family N-acetyltransferase [Planctomycetota bacterium]MCB9911456.1 GNAT family N-acetyltransferase [Planctomycetota bacterium]
MHKDLNHWTPRPLPESKPLEGRFCRLEPLSAQEHGQELFALSSSPEGAERFRWLPDSPCQEFASFAPWLQAAETSRDPKFYAVRDLRSGRVGGRQALMAISADNGSIELGHVLWGDPIARSPVTTEAFFLTARYLFEDLGYRRLEWKTDNRNEASKRAALRFGMQPEGLFRQHRVVKGTNRDTAWFSMLDIEWPACGAALRAWLAPTNFDANGQQVQRLETLRA